MHLIVPKLFLSICYIFVFSPESLWFNNSVFVYVLCFTSPSFSCNQWSQYPPRHCYHTCLPACIHSYFPVFGEAWFLLTTCCPSWQLTTHQKRCELPVLKAGSPWSAAGSHGVRGCCGLSPEYRWVPWEKPMSVTLGISHSYFCICVYTTILWCRRIYQMYSVYYMFYDFSVTMWIGKI